MQGAATARTGLHLRRQVGGLGEQGLRLLDGILTNLEGLSDGLARPNSMIRAV